MERVLKLESCIWYVIHMMCYSCLFLMLKASTWQEYTQEKIESINLKYSEFGKLRASQDWQDKKTMKTTRSKMIKPVAPLIPNVEISWVSLKQKKRFSCGKTSAAPGLGTAAASSVMADSWQMAVSLLSRSRELRMAMDEVRAPWGRRKTWENCRKLPKVKLTANMEDDRIR